MVLTMTTTLLLGITTHTTAQQAVEQETIPHSRTTMVPAIRYRQVLVVDNITQTVMAIRCMYRNVAILTDGKINIFVAIRKLYELS